MVKHALASGNKVPTELRSVADLYNQITKESTPQERERAYRTALRYAAKVYGIKTYDDTRGRGALAITMERAMKLRAEEDLGEVRHELPAEVTGTPEPAPAEPAAGNAEWVTEHADEITTWAYHTALASGASESMAEDVASQLWLEMREGRRKLTDAARADKDGLARYVRVATHSVLSTMRRSEKHRAGYERRGGQARPVTEERKLITTPEEATKAIKLALPGSVVEDNGDGSMTVTLTPGGEQFTVDLVQKIRLTPAQWDAKERRDRRKYSVQVRRTVSALGSMQVRTKDGRIIPNRTIMQLALGVATEGTPAHETVHLARAIGAFTAAQWKDLVQKYSKPGASLFQQEEDVAGARAQWVTRDWWQKLKDFCRKLLSSIVPGWRSRAEDVMRLMDTAQFWADVGANATDAERKYMVAAWHGSAREFKKFTTKKIGTGEGAQVFGWGLYFTDEENIAKHYAEMGAGQQLHDASIGTRRLIARKAKEWVASRTPGYHSSSEQQAITKELDRYAEGEVITPMWLTQNPYNVPLIRIGWETGVLDKSRNLYKATIWKNKQEKLLDWDAPLTDDMKSIINEIWPDESDEEWLEDARGIPMDEWTGEDFYRALAKYSQENVLPGTEDLDSSNDPSGQQAASVYLLRKQGYDGIVYRAGQRSGMESKAKNYVVFDESAIEVEEHTKYEMPDIPAEQPAPKAPEPAPTAKTPDLIKAAKKNIAAMDLRHVPVEQVDTLRGLVKALRPETQASDFQAALHKAVEGGNLATNVYVKNAEGRLSELQGSIGDMAPADARTVINAVQSIVGTEANRNRLFGSEKFKDRNAAVKSMADAATKRLGTGNVVPLGQAPERAGLPWFRHIAYYMNLIPASLSRRLFGMNEVARDLLVDSFSRGASEFNRLEKGVTARTDEFMKSAGLTAKDVTSWIGRKRKLRVSMDVALPSGVRLQMPKGQFLGLVLSLRDQRTRSEILAGSPVVLEKAGDPIKLGEADIAAIEAAVQADRKLASAAAGLNRLLNEGELSDEFFKAWRDIHGVDLGRKADYFPSARDQASLPPDAEAEMREWQAETLESRSPFRERTSGTQPFLIRDAFESVDYVQRMQALYAAKHRPTMDAMAVLADPAVVRAVRGGFKHGEHLLGILKKRAQEYNGAQGYTGKYDFMDRAVKWFMRQRHRTALAFKPWIWLYQPVSLIAVVARMPARFVVLGVVNSTRHYQESLKAMSAASGTLDARIKADVHDRISPTLSFGEGFSNRWGIHETPWVDNLTVGMGAIRKMDTRAIAAIWEACLAEAREQGLKGEELTRAAARRCERIVEDTQSTFDDHTLSALQAWGRQTPLAKFLSMFSSQTTKNFSLLDEAVQDLMHPEDVGGKAAAWRSAGKKVATVMAQNMAMYGIRTGFFVGLAAGASVVASWLGRGSPPDPDKEETWADHLVLLLDSMFGNVPGLGQAFQAARRAWMPTTQEAGRMAFSRRVLEVDAFKPVVDGISAGADLPVLVKRMNETGWWSNWTDEQKLNAARALVKDTIRAAGGLGAGEYAPTDALIIVADPLYEAILERPEKIPGKAYGKALSLTADIPEQKDDESYEDFWRRFIKVQKEREAAQQWLAGLDLTYYDLLELVRKGAQERGMNTEAFKNGKPTRWNDIEDSLILYGRRTK